MSRPPPLPRPLPSHASILGDTDPVPRACGAVSGMPVAVPARCGDHWLPGYGCAHEATATYTPDTVKPTLVPDPIDSAAHEYVVNRRDRPPPLPRSNPRHQEILLR